MKLSPYLAACKAQGVDLHPRIEQALASGYSGNGFSFEPTKPLAAIRAAGVLLQGDDSVPLASKPLEPRGALMAGADTTALTMLIDTSIEPASAVAAAYDCGPYFGEATTHVCIKSEQRFGDAAVRGLMDPDNASGRFASQVIVGDDGKPLFWRKNNGERTALALQDYQIDGVQFPAGSFACVTFAHDEVDNGRLVPSKIHELGVQALPASDIDEVMFLRHSGFGYQPAERQRVFARALEPMQYKNGFGRMVDTASDAGRDFAATATLDDIRQLASTAIGTLHAPKSGKLF